MWIFQAPYNAIKRFKCRWFVDLMEIIQNKILWPALQIVGEAGKEFIMFKIKEAAEQDNLSGAEKFEYVFKACEGYFTGINISNHLLRTIIQLLYATFKESE